MQKPAELPQACRAEPLAQSREPWAIEGYSKSWNLMEFSFLDFKIAWDWWLLYSFHFLFFGMVMSLTLIPYLCPTIRFWNQVTCGYSFHRSTDKSGILSHHGSYWVSSRHDLDDFDVIFDFWVDDIQWEIKSELMPIMSWDFQGSWDEVNVFCTWKWCAYFEWSQTVGGRGLNSDLWKFTSIPNPRTCE